MALSCSNGIASRSIRNCVHIVDGMGWINEVESVEFHRAL